jgi:aspartyl-tRNA synthetase
MSGPGVRGLQSPILKFLPKTSLQRCSIVAAPWMATSFFGADAARVVNDAMGALRNQLAMTSA